MSIEAMSWVWENSMSTGNDRLVLLALADNADETWTCWPSIAYIKRKTKIGDERTVQRTLRRLEEAGRIRVVVGAGPQKSVMHRTNRYWVLKDAEVDRVTDAPPGDVPPPGEMPPGGSDATSPPALVPPAPPAGDPPEPSVEPSGNHLAPTKVDAVEVASLRSAILAACEIGPDLVTPSAAGPINKATHDLTVVGAAAADVPAAARSFRKRFPDATLTPMALAKHWPQLASSAATSPALSEPERFGISLARTSMTAGEAFEEITGQFDDCDLQLTALHAFTRIRDGQRAAV